MRLLFISHSARLDGAELGLLELASGLVEEGISVDVVVPRAGPLSDSLRSVGAVVIVQRSHWWAGDRDRPLRVRAYAAARNFVAAIAIARLVRRLRPNLVITNSIVIPAGAFGAAIARTPHLWFLHEFGVRDHGMTFDFGHRRSLHLISWLSKLVVVHSEALREDVERVIPTKVRLVH
jgi:hypothetical protein